MKFIDALKIYKQSHPGTSLSINLASKKKNPEVYEAVKKIINAEKEEKIANRTPRQLAAFARHARQDKEFKERFAAVMAAPRAMSFKEAFAARDAAAPKKRVFKVASAAAEERLAAEAAKDAPAAPKQRVFKVVKDAPAEAAPAAPKQRVFKVVKKPEQVEEEVTEKPRMSTTVLAANIRAYKAKNIEN